MGPDRGSDDLRRTEPVAAVARPETDERTTERRPSRESRDANVERERVARRPTDIEIMLWFG
ncbi:MAG TPA: hypothetical protein VEY67_05820 [Candidatus Dormibacteraeota bacterium]|nr:hypothetical protein [Candidatus Dormibacteraeota bacterium]